MSLEKMLEANTAAVERQNELLAQMIANQEKALGKVAAPKDDEDEAPKSRRRAAKDDEAEEPKTRSRRSAAKDEDAEEEAPKTRRRAAKDDEEEEAEEEAPKTRRRAAKDDEEEEAPKTRRRAAKDDEEEAPKSRSRSKSKGPTMDGVKAAISKFIDVEEEDDEKERRDFIDSMLDHLEADRTTDIKEDDFEAVLGWLEDKAAGKKVRFD